MTIDERLEKLTERHEALTLSLELLEKRQQDLTQSVKLLSEKQDHEAAALRQDLRRAVRLGVAEARNHRVRLRTLDDSMTRLAAAQLVTEEKVTAIGSKLEGLIDALRRGGNGRP
jgi:hypothetical protein